jgi:hypothetical protein
MSEGDHRRGGQVALPTAGQTVVSLRLRSVDEAGPWPLTRVLSTLSAFDVERVGVARALGDRRGVPLVHSQELIWRGHPLFLEVRHGRDGADELILELPPWDEVADGVEDADIWALVDSVAAASDAAFGSIGDGEPPETAMPDDAAMLAVQLRRHLALLLPQWVADDIAASGATAARELAASGLVVVTP